MDVADPVGLSVGLRNFSAVAPGSWADLLDRAVDLEAAGVDRVVVSDHVVFGMRLDAYGDPTVGGLAGGRQPTGPDGHWLEPLTLLSFVAARTHRVRLGTNVLVAALRRPVVLAKTVATLDVLSGGRVDLGVGVGWQEAEYRAAGLEFSQRGHLLDDTLEVCRSLWTGEPVELGASEPLVQARPTPLQPGGVPIWVSGSVHPRVVRRTARFGRGWIPWGDALADLPGALPTFRAAVDREIAARRASGESTTVASAAELHVVGTLRVDRPDGPGEVGAVVRHALDRARPLLDAGVDDLRVSFGADDPGAVDVAAALAVGVHRHTRG